MAWILRGLTWLLMVGSLGMVFAQEMGRSGIRPEALEILAQDGITLTDLFRLADLISPALAAARSEVEARTGQARQAALYPNPEFEIGVEEWSTANPESRKDRVALVQPLIIGGRRGAATAAARAGRESAGFDLLSARRQILRRVHTLFGEQLYFREAEAAFGELLAVAERTLEIARVRFESRAAPESQVTKALLEVYGLEVTRQQLELERVRASAELAAVFGGVEVPEDRLAGTLNPKPARVAEEGPPDGLADHPALKSARKTIDAAEADLRRAKAERIPDLGIQVAYGRLRPLNESYVEAGISLPLPLFDRNQGRVAESLSLVAAARHRLRQVENDLAAALAAARQRYATTREQLDAVADQIVPAAERGLEQAQEAYRVGRLPFLELLDAQRTLADVRAQNLALRRDLMAAEAELQSLRGDGPYGDPGELP